MEDARHDLPDGSNAVGKVLLADERRKPPVAGWPRRGQIQEMPDDALPDGCEGVSSELFEDIWYKRWTDSSASAQATAASSRAILFTRATSRK